MDTESSMWSLCSLNNYQFSTASAHLFRDTLLSKHFFRFRQVCPHCYHSAWELGFKVKKHKSFWWISGSVESRETTSNGDTRGLYQALAASWCTMCLYLIKKCALVQNSTCKSLAWEMSYWMSSSFQ